MNKTADCFVVITAGGAADNALQHQSGARHKALASIGRGKLIDPVIASARAVGVAGIAVVAPPEVAAHCAGRVERIVPAFDNGSANIRAALFAFPDAQRLLYLTSDLPFVTPTALGAFIAASAPFDLTMALAPVQAYERAFPGAPAHSVRLGRYRYANGSAFIIDRCAVTSLATYAGQFFAARKSLVHLAMLLGPALCLRFALGRLQLAQIEGHVSRRLHVEARAVVNAAPELCYDIDTVAEFLYAQRYLASR